MLFKVGELAKSIGLTVRALHYYDRIGLLKPSGRSESGYRLYNETDVARLHGIQALRRLNLPLSDISRLFQEGSASLPLLISQQIEALEHEMTKAAEMRNRLLFIQEKFAVGVDPEVGTWLSTLNLMATYSRYFSPDELRKILANWNKLSSEWQPVIAGIRGAMQRELPAASGEAQALARRWIDLSVRWMEGNVELIQRWGNMCRNEPLTHGSSGIDAPLLAYISRAVELRLQAYHRHFAPAELMRIRQVPEQEWTSLGDAVERLLQESIPVDSKQARQLAVRWSELVDQLTANDPVIKERYLQALRSEPVIQAGTTLSAEACGYIDDAYCAFTAGLTAAHSKKTFSPA